jgi:hypothetical protein
VVPPLALCFVPSSPLRRPPRGRPRGPNLSRRSLPLPSLPSAAAGGSRRAKPGRLTAVAEEPLLLAREGGAGHPGERKCASDLSLRGGSSLPAASGGGWPRRCGTLDRRRRGGLWWTGRLWAWLALLSDLIWPEWLARSAAAEIVAGPCA